MNYEKVYSDLMFNRWNDPILDGECYFEVHHIEPKSLGGTDDDNNLIRLTAREHFLAHYLLAKMYKKESNEWYKMNHAFMKMKCSSLNQKRYFNSRLYEGLRCNFSKVMSFSQSGSKNSQFGTFWITNGKDNKKIPKGEEIQEGWRKGRFILPKFEIDKPIPRKIIETKLNKRMNEVNNFIKNFRLSISIKETVDMYNCWYKIYTEFGFDVLCEKTGYNKSKQNLVQQFKRHVKDFKPQNGKKRGKKK